MNEEELQAHIKNNPDDQQAYQSLCDIYSKRQDFTQLSFLLEKALAQFPQAPYFYSVRASLWLTLKKWENAEADFKKVISLDAKNAIAYDSLGVLLQQKNQFEQAALLHQKALSLQPDHIGFLFNLAVAFDKTGRRQQSQEIYKALIKAVPSHRQAHINLAVLEEEQGNVDQAETYFMKALELGQPDFTLCMGLGSVYRRKQDTQKAIEWYEKAHTLKPDHPVALFMLRHMKGESPELPPDAFVSGLFDGFADVFDDKLLKTLHYQTPLHMQEMLKPYLSFLEKTDDPVRIIDLGCGTGLMGPILRPVSAMLVGVDLSSRMLTKAQERKIYDELVCMNIVTYLSEQKPVTAQLITAADVFVYMGDLADVLKETSRVLTSQGRFCFSVEAMNKNEEDKAGDKGYILRDTARYAHSAAYIKNLAQENGLTIEAIEKKNIRLNKGQPIEGWLVLCKK